MNRRTFIGGVVATVVQAQAKPRLVRHNGVSYNSLGIDFTPISPHLMQFTNVTDQPQRYVIHLPGKILREATLGPRATVQIPEYVPA